MTALQIPPERDCVVLLLSSFQRTVSTLHSSGFARLEFEAFYFEAIKVGQLKI